MTEAWKSVPKKFCKICKCWFYDNKVSVQHHEQGSRHKFNMNNKLHEIGKKGRERQQESREMRSALATMELEALRSYKKDLKESPKLAEQYNIHMNLAALPIRAFPKQNFGYGTGSTFQQPHLKLKQGISTVWHETADPTSGRSYFWNTQTGVTRWDVPEEGYLSIGELQQAAEYEMQAGQQASTSSDIVQPTEEFDEDQEDPDAETEPPPPPPQPKPRRKYLADEDNPDYPDYPEPEAVPFHSSAADKAVEEIGFADTATSVAAKPFGAWETVDVVHSKYGNKHGRSEEHAEDSDEEKKKVKKLKFAEKKMPTISATSANAIQFKKRNKGGAAKNLRKTIDDD